MPLPISFPNPFADEDTLDADLMNALAAYLEALAGASAVTPAGVYRWTMFHDESVVLNGNALALLYESWGGGTFEGVFARQETSALNDEFKNGMYLAADTYTLQIVGKEDASSGVITWYVDDVSVGTTDLYAASDAHVVKTISSIVIGSAGWHNIRGKLESKNGSSSGYDANLFKYSMTGSLA